jgi:hypothetical protein
MKVTEEHVTRKLAKMLALQRSEIIAVHPPGGQGPFVIPKVAKLDNIERSSYHPDIVAIRTNSNGSITLIIAECKLEESDVSSDLAKLTELAKSHESLLYALYRCSSFEKGPKTAFDFIAVSNLSIGKLPVEFVLACKSNQSSIKALQDIEKYKATLYTFSEYDLLKY